ncbi:Down syndrome cell adhesion molecule-like protein Dscam2 [Araneus ventricosus]|uniref:Down syndrome cell adhesion molecule-like protein Dscam2 n=1 Tax=Araneus ventricosus TaxID=182803 RepID=A0A4Y2GUP1_ARAVE|nr:Down syndrome cell adhesion molecule-like protein Dscam2 [Araneus ventricosus]
MARVLLLLTPERYRETDLDCYISLGEPSRKDQRGPVFRTEPSSRVEFSNSSGTELRCSADGTPTPRLTWQTREGGNARDVAGLRYARSDGTLVFPPFARNDYRQDVHDSVYQCLAANTVGSIVSREVHVRGGKNLHLIFQMWR